MSDAPTVTLFADEVEPHDEGIAAIAAATKAYGNT